MAGTGLVIGLLFAFLVSLLVARLVMAAGILDHPNARSSHSDPTPRGGGLGVLAGTMTGWALMPVTGPAEAASLSGIAICGLMAGGLGLLDDLFVLSERLKFLVLLALSLAIAAMAGPVVTVGLGDWPWWLGLAGSALFVFTTVNAVNFMDGSDGLILACLVPACLVLGILAGSPAPWILAAALAGLAVWNAPVLRERGRLFGGDVGALGAAMLLAGLALDWSAGAGGGSAWLAALLVLPLLGDVLLTMGARVKAGRSPFLAHRAHAYQLLIRTGASHRTVALLWGGMSVACGALALIATALPVAGQIAVFVIAVLVFAGIHNRIRARARTKLDDIYQ